MRFVGLVLIASTGVACGGVSEASHREDPTEATGGAAEGTGAIPSQACATDEDCETGNACVHYGADGPSECVLRRAPVTGCEEANDRDQCCSTADCESGECYSTVVAAGLRCGRGGFDVYNQCLRDGCASDADCSASEACLPGTYGDLRTCLAVDCRTNADCAAAPGGACIAFGDRCCSQEPPSRTYIPRRLTCVYPQEGCKEDADCPPTQHCVAKGGRARCANGCL